MANIVFNSIRTPDGTVLTSYHRLDFVSHTDANGVTYFIDGGPFYAQRTSLEDHPYEDLSIYDDDDFSIVREHFHWGARGKNGDQPVQWIPLSQLETAHIEAILATQKYLPDHHRVLFKKELDHRSDVSA